MGRWSPWKKQLLYDFTVLRCVLVLADYSTFEQWQKCEKRLTGKTKAQKRGTESDIRKEDTW